METGMEQPLPRAVDTSNEHEWLEANEAKKKKLCSDHELIFMRDSGGTSHRAAKWKITDLIARLSPWIYASPRRRVR